MRPNEHRRPAGNGTAATSSAGGPDHQDTATLPLETGTDRRDAGIDAARHNTHPGYRLEVDRTIRALADARVEFTAETVRAHTGDPLASHPNALSAAIGAAVRAGIIECVGYQPAARPEAHRRILRVWRGVGT